MAFPVFTFQPTTNWSVPVYPVYADQTHILTSVNLKRFSYKIIADVMINDNKVATLKCYPFNNMIEVNPQKIAENYLLHNFNYSASSVADNIDSIKKVKLVVGEEYSRQLAFSSITEGFGFVRLNFDAAPSVSNFDRVFIVKDNASINPQYNTYAKVIGSGATHIIVDLEQVPNAATETGIIYEGCEFYDNDYNGIHTSNPHKFNVGDTVFIQMDSWAKATIKLNSGNSGQITQITIDGHNLLSSPVPYSSSIATTMDNLANAIGTTASVGLLYNAYHLAGSSIIHIYSQRDKGDYNVGKVITITSTGNLNFSKTNMYKASGTDALGQGWNPQMSGVFTVKTVPNSTTFTVNESLSAYYNSEPGSERGSIYSMNNYVFTGLTTSNTYFVMNNKNYYDQFDYRGEVEKHAFEGDYNTGLEKGKFLTAKPRTSFNFYSLNDIETADLLYPNQNTGVGEFNGGNQQGFYVTTYTGDTETSAHTYFVDISYLTSGFTSPSLYWKRYSFGVGPWNLNRIHNSHFTPYVSQMITNDVVKYTVTCNNGQMIDGEAIDYSETLTFTRKCFDNKYYQLIFLNKWGSYDYFPVLGNYETNLAVERYSFDKKRESATDKNHYGSSVKDRGITNFNIKSLKSIKLYTDWLSLEESEWLAEVFESPSVYLYCPTEGNKFTINSDLLFPIDITNSEAILPNERSRLRTFEITANISNRRINQKN